MDQIIPYKWEPILAKRKKEFQRLKKENRHWVYIILDLGLHKPFLKPTSRIRFENNKHGFSATIRPLFLPERNGSFYENDAIIPNGLYTISLEHGKKEDKLAQRIVDALWAGLAMMRHTYLDKLPFTLCVPKCLVTSSPNLGKETLIAWHVVDSDSPCNADFLLWRMKSKVNFASTVVAKVWKILPALMQKGMFEASQFMYASVQDFNFAGDSASEVIYNPNMAPLSFVEQVSAEGAVLNAYKAIEALIGDPPKDDTKLRGKLMNIGVDPDEPLGFQFTAKEPVLKVIRRLNEYRDRKTAHGSTPYPRETKYFEVYEFQECALVLLGSAVEKYLKRKL